MLLQELSKKEVWAKQKEWRSIFAIRLRRLTGRWTRGSSDRLVFNHTYIGRYLTGAAAEYEYANAPSEETWVLEDAGNWGELHDSKPPLGDYLEKRAVLIFPNSFDWTLVTGPDSFSGVYFTYRSWIDPSPEGDYA